MEKIKYYSVYKIINKLNNCIYIGCHVTENLNDNYMGSGINICKAIKQYGRYNFTKEILYVFDNKIDMLNKERELVNENFIKNENTYNLVIGGSSGLINRITVKDKDDNKFLIFKNDPRYLSGELVSISKNKVSVKDKDGNSFKVDINDPRYLSGELVHNMVGMLLVKDIFNNKYIVKLNDEKIINGEFVANQKGMVTVRDKNGKCFNTSMYDPKFLNGEYIHVNKGRKDTLETILKKSGTNNSQYGKIQITNHLLKENKKIKEEDLKEYLNNGQEKGRNYFNSKKYNLKYNNL